MNTKLLLSFVIGSGLGAAGAWLLPSRGNDLEDGKSRLDSLTAELGRKTQEIKDFKKRFPADPDSVASLGKTAEDKAAIARQIDEANLASQKAVEASKKRAEKVKQKMEARLQSKVDEKLAVLKTKLGLSDAQMASFGPLMLEHLKKSQVNMFGVGLSYSDANTENSDPKNREKEMFEGFLDPLKREKALDAKLQALLEPAQLESYAAHKKEERANQVEVATNKEMARLQGAMTLTTEQKDQVFGVLNALTEKEADTPISGVMMLMAKSPGGLEEAKKEIGEENTKKLEALMEESKLRQNRRKEALAAVLSPEQMKVYEGVQLTGSLDMTDLMGDMGMGMEMMMMEQDEAEEGSDEPPQPEAPTAP
jgi:hypothetical protein